MTDDDEFKFGIWWKPDSAGGFRNASPRECAAEILRLRKYVDRLDRQARAVVALFARAGGE